MAVFWALSALVSALFAVPWALSALVSALFAVFCALVAIVLASFTCAGVAAPTFPAVNVISCVPSKGTPEILRGVASFCEATAVPVDGNRVLALSFADFAEAMALLCKSVTNFCVGANAWLVPVLSVSWVNPFAVNVASG